MLDTEFVRLRARNQGLIALDRSAWATSVSRGTFDSVRRTGSAPDDDLRPGPRAGGPLARRRKAEVEEADGILGVITEILDIPPGLVQEPDAVYPQP